MIVYRVGKTRWARDLTGEGARFNGGRWNHQLIPCIYTSESRALSVLEYTVNVSIDDIPRSLSITSFEIPDTGIRELFEATLPGNWKATPAPSSTMDFGTRLLQDRSDLIYKIPSSVISDEFNYIINPLHPGNSLVRILGEKDFVHDVRIKF